jgi:RNA polymerase sigma factor (sigma-70 family)
LPEDWQAWRRLTLDVARGRRLEADEAEDVAQDNLLGLLTTVSRNPDLVLTVSYVRGAAHHSVDRYLYSKVLRRHREVQMPSDDTPRRHNVDHGRSEDAHRERPKPAPMAHRAMDVDAILDSLEARTILEALSPQDRSLCELSAAGWSSSEIGERLGITAEAARKRLQRLREQHQLLRLDD